MEVIPERVVHTKFNLTEKLGVNWGTEIVLNTMIRK